MHKRLAVLLLAAVCGAALAGCGQESQVGRDELPVESALAALNTFTREIIERVESAPDPAAGVDEAQRYFDSRRADIEAKLRPLNGADDSRLSEQTRRKVMEQRTEAEMSISKLRLRYFDNSMRDPAFKAKLGKLIADYQHLLKSVAEGER